MRFLKAILAFLFTANCIFVYSKDDLKKVSFEDVRSLLKNSGITTIGKLKIEGDVVSDRESKNLEINPNLHPKGGEIDFSVNDRTVYLQEESGRYGFRIQLMSIEDNVFSRYDKVVLNLEGLTLQREENPIRYTIIGLTADNVISSEKRGRGGGKSED